MRKVVSVAFAVIAAAAVNAVTGARGRPRGRARHRRQRRRLGDLGRGRPLGGQHERQLVERRRPRLDRVLRQRGQHRRGDPRLPSLEGRRDPHRRRRGVGRTSPARARAPTRSPSQRQRLQAGPGLLRRRRRAHRPGAGAAAVRRDPQREDGRRPHRRQQLRLRRHRPAVRDRLAHVAVVVEELLPRRLEHDLEVHRRERRRHDDARHRTRSSTCAPRCATPATATGRGRCSRRPTRRRCRAAPQIRYSQTGYTRQTIGGCGVWNADADWANDTVVAKLNSTVRNAAAADRTHEHQDLRGAERARRPPPVREHRRPARGAGARELALGRRGRQDRSGSRRSARRRRCSARTSSRRTCIRPTGASWRCATACARPTTAARRAAGTCSRTTTGLNALGEPNMSLG